MKFTSAKQAQRELIQVQRDIRDGKGDLEENRKKRDEINEWLDEHWNDDKK